jgi:N-acetylglucosamine malate deacetylase 1
VFDPKKILILAPHTDDGELGCGATIAKFCDKGKQVYYSAFSLCAKSLAPGLPADTLAKECKQATSVLGIHPQNVLLLDYEVRNFAAKRQEILEELVKLNKTIEPDLVLIPCATDIHQDHAVIHAEALRAFKNVSLLGYELPWNQTQFNIAYFSVLDPEHIVKKINSIKAYTSQIQRNYMQEDFIASLAKVRGIQANSNFAEAFEVYRIIN